MKNAEGKGKWLALILRHQPEKANLKLDLNGWAKVSDITDPLKGGIPLGELTQIVEEDKKGRYEFSDDKTRIRACQGHSIPVELELKARIPPVVLLHGTKSRFLKSIIKEGLIPGARNHVHLSGDRKTAQDVANRRSGESIILEIDALSMVEDGNEFYLSNNGVWLVDLVLPKYINNFNNFKTR